MPQTTESTTAAQQGAYVVDIVASTENDPFSVAVWTGRIQHVRPDGTYLLIARTGYEWPVEAGESRPATDAEREAYERVADGGTRPPRSGAAVS